MGFFKAPQRFTQLRKDPLLKYYQERSPSDSSPFSTALANLEHLEQEATDDEGLILYCLEDSTYFSLQATCYEEILMALVKHPQIVHELLGQFNESKGGRDHLLLKQSQAHVNYVAQGGHCPGCEQCENHKDVDELISFYQEGDLSFFLELYVGMQTVQLGIEELIFRFFKENPSSLTGVTRDRILNYRTHIFNDSRDKFQKMMAS